jgi:hypothetical protein
MSDQANELCGPAELIAKLIEYRQTTQPLRREIYGNISDDGVRRLVMLSYFASQSVEEGRYPRFRLFVPPPTGNTPKDWPDPWQLAKFSQPILLQEVDDVRRLAPSAASHDLALEIHECHIANDASELCCAGIRLAHSGESTTEIFSTSLWSRLVPPGLMIRIDGPGELRVSEGKHAWDLRAGKLFDLGGIVTQPLALWLNKLTRQLTSENQPELLINHTLHFAWHELLHAVSEQRRGGCLLILPEASLTAMQVKVNYGISLKYQMDGPHLGDEIAGFVKSCSTKQAIEDVGELKDSANRWLRQRHKLFLHVDALAEMAGVDGCTVFDGDLRLIGFGGKIDDPPATVAKELVDARNGDVLNADVMSRTGTRHRSAYRLCDAHGGVWSYVVSQDGQVTAFWSDDLNVKRWHPYWPWAKMSDQF